MSGEDLVPLQSPLSTCIKPDIKCIGYDALLFLLKKVFIAHSLTVITSKNTKKKLQQRFAIICDKEIFKEKRNNKRSRMWSKVLV